MARRRVWPRNADDYRVATVVAAREGRRLLNETDDWREIDPVMWRQIKADLKVILSDIERWQTLARYGLPEEPE
jgi:hypothetical protein